MNWDDRKDPYDPYYVEDGRFANFPLRQNRTGLCDESAGIFNDAKYLPFCKAIMESPSFHHDWQSYDASTSGIWPREPRDLSAFKYVSARRWNVYGSKVSDVALKKLIPSHEYLNQVLSQSSAQSIFDKIGANYIHGYAHLALGGMWGGGE